MRGPRRVAVSAALVFSGAIRATASSSPGQRRQRRDRNALPIDAATGALKTTGSGSGGTSAISGDTAAGSADAGAPVKIGGKAATAPPSDAVAGNRVNAYMDLKGRLCVKIGDAGVDATVVTAADANNYNGNGMYVVNTPELYNGGAGNTSSDMTNYDARGVVVVISITSGSGAALVFTIKGKDTLGGTYSTILASAAQAGTGTVVLKVYPGITAAANLSVSDILPRVWRLEVSGSGTLTFSASANYVK
jgi:hypothetical protein